MYGEIQSHFSTLKASGETRVKDNFRSLEHGDEVFIIARVQVNKITFPQDADGLIQRVHSSKAKELFVVSPEDYDKIAAKYQEEVNGQLSIVGEIERSIEEPSDNDD